MQLKDEELVAKYKESRNYQYLTELFTRHSGLLYRSAFRIMKNSSDSEDILQTAYMKMISSLSDFKGTGSVVGWMLQVVIHTCYENLRSEKSRSNRERKVMSERSQTANPKNYELTETVETHLNKLPEIYKAPIILKIMEGLSVKEVSDALNVPEKTIRSQISRGLEKLKESLQSVGVTASILFISNALQSVQKSSAPEIYASKEYFNQLCLKQSSASTKMMATSFSNGMSFQKVVVMSLLTATLAGGLSFWSHSTGIAKAPIIKMQEWDFENTTNLENYMNLRLLDGAISIADSLGVNRSKALKIEEDSVIEIDISAYQLPIKISYKTDRIYAVNRGEEQGLSQMVIKNNYRKDQKIFKVSGIRENVEVVANRNQNKNLGYFGHWFAFDVYIDENSVDSFLDGKRSHYLEGSSLDNNKLYLTLGKNSLIEDLKIETVDTKDLPDKKKYEEICIENSHAKEDEHVSISKEKLGLSLDTKVKPYLRVIKPNFFALMGLADKKSISPSLNASNRIQWVRERQKGYKKWTFTDKNEINDFRVIQGKTAISTLGLEGSNCMEIDAGTVLEIDISQYQMPLKISLHLDTLPPTPGKKTNGMAVFKGDYEKNRNVFHFAKLAPPRLITHDNSKDDRKGYEGRWPLASFYIAEDVIEAIYNDILTTLTIGRSTANNKIYMQFQDKYLADNIIIETVDDIPPDYKVYKEYADSLPFEKGRNNYSALEKEKPPLYLDKRSSPELGVFDKEYIESALGLK